MVEEIGKPRAVQRVDSPLLRHALLERVGIAGDAGQQAGGDPDAGPPVREEGDEGDEEEELLDDGEPPG